MTDMMMVTVMLFNYMKTLNEKIRIPTIQVPFTHLVYRQHPVNTTKDTHHTVHPLKYTLYTQRKRKCSPRPSHVLNPNKNTEFTQNCVPMKRTPIP